MGIAGRTGLAQSYVSTLVRALETDGRVESRPDPGDGRRRRVRVVDQVSAAILDAAARPIDGMIDDVIPHDVSAMQAIAMLEELAEMFLADDTNGRT